MIKKIFFVIIVLILIYDLYDINKNKYFNKFNTTIKNIHNKSTNIISNNESTNDNDNESENESDNKSDNEEENDNEEESDNEEAIVNLNIIESQNQNNQIESFNNIPQILHPKHKLNTKENKNVKFEEIDINKFGKPYDYKPNEYVHWDFYDPQPWTKIIYKYGENDPYNFYLKVAIPSLNDYENWKNYLTNINFEPRSGEIVISCQDEETALSIGNLVVSNFKGDIKFDEIVNKDLIGVSIIKCKKHEIVKNKIKEQIIQNMVIKSTNFNDLNKKKDNTPVNIPAKKDDNQSNNYYYYNDKNIKKSNEYDAYDGNEFSFI